MMTGSRSDSSTGKTRTTQRPAVVAIGPAGEVFEPNSYLRTMMVAHAVPVRGGFGGSLGIKKPESNQCQSGPGSIAICGPAWHCLKPVAGPSVSTRTTSYNPEETVSPFDFKVAFGQNMVWVMDAERRQILMPKGPGNARLACHAWVVTVGMSVSLGPKHHAQKNDSMCTANMPEYSLFQAKELLNRNSGDAYLIVGLLQKLVYKRK